MNGNEFILKAWPFFISAIPIALRTLIDFKKEETCISNNKKALLNQIRFLLSENHARSIIFNNEIEVKINEDFYSKLQDKYNDLFYSETNTLFDFYSAKRLSVLAIRWSRYLKYLLVILSTFSIILFSFALYISGDNINLLIGISYFAIITLIIVLTWIIKEKNSDSFFNLCSKYEIERKE